MYKRFPAPQGKPEFDAKSKAYRAMRAAERVAARLDREQKTHTHSNHLEAIHWSEDYADGSLDSRHVELGVYAGDWNSIDTYNRDKGTRETVPGGTWPEMLGARLERLGADVVWSDQHSMCGECNLLISTNADHMVWVPKFAVGHGYITCKKCILDNIGSTDEIIAGAAKALYADAWCRVNEECNAVSVSGQEIMSLIGDIPEDAEAMALKWLGKLCEANDLLFPSRVPNLPKLLSKVLQLDLNQGVERDYGSDYAESLGHYLVMQGLGHGVAWSDDHADHGFTMPHLDSCGLDDQAAESLGAELVEYEDGECKWQVPE